MTTLAERVDRLFQEFRRPDGREYSYLDVERGTQPTVTGAYVWKLRTGRATNPGYRVLKALSDFFQVPVTYFFQDELADSEMAALKLAARLQRESVAQLALRASELDEQALEMLLTLVEYLRQAQGLDSHLEEK